MDQKDEVPHGVTMGWIRKREVDQPESFITGRTGWIKNGRRWIRERRVDQGEKRLDQGEELHQGDEKGALDLRTNADSEEINY